MNYEKLAELLFPHIDKTPADYEAMYPARDLPAGAKVTDSDRARPVSFTSVISTARS